MRLVSTTLILSLFTLNIQAQSTNPVPWYELIDKKDINYYDIEKAYEEGLKGISEAEKESHSKHFNRWKRDVIGFVEPDGHILNTSQRMSEAMRVVSNKRSIAGNWKEIGPFTARDIYRGVGRVNCIAFHPTDSNIMWAGAPYGGVWKTVDYGDTWTNLTDHLPSFGVTAIAVHPDNPDILYVGTGDGNTYRNPGLGIWKTENGGSSWQNISGQIGDRYVNDILIYEDNPDQIIAATNTGIWRTPNAGATWLLATGGKFRELRFKPDDPSVIYAATDGILFVSTDRGLRWERILHPGVPVPSPLLSIAVSPAAPNLCYLVSEQNISIYHHDKGEIELLERNDDQRDLGSQSWYNTTAELGPDSAGVLFQGHVPTYVTRNNTESWTRMSGVHSDVHYMRHSPITGRLWLCGDGGVVSLGNDGETFTDRTNMGVAEIYKMAQHPFELDHMLNGYQDCGTKYYIGSSWLSRVGADGMDCVFDPDSPEIYFTTIQYGDIRRHIGGPEGNVNNFPDPQGDSRTERGPWVSPITLDKGDPTILYTAQHSVYRYRNAREDRPRKNRWENINNGLPTSGEFAEIEQNDASPRIMFVTNGSYVYRCMNIYAEDPQWESLADNYPRTAAILDVECAGTDSNIVFISMNQRVLRSEDLGESFTELNQGLPELPIYSLQYDPIDSNLYAGTDVGVYVLRKGDSIWQNFSNGMSLSAPVYEVEIFYDADNHQQSMIKAATYGRGMWESPLYGSFPDPELPFYANISYRGEPLLKQEDFTVELSFRRGLQFVDVEGVEAGDFELFNCQIEDIRGQGSRYIVKMKALSNGKIRLSYKEGGANRTDNQSALNKASDVLEFNIVNDGTHFGYEGPGGIGSLDQIALWLDAAELSSIHSSGEMVHIWPDKLNVAFIAKQADTLNGPLFYTGDTLFNGEPYLQFDSLGLRKLRVDSFVVDANITAITVAASNDHPFNDHAWMGSSRTENGYIIHNYREHDYARMFIYDSTNQRFRSSSVPVSEVRDPHIYGLSYRNNIYIWNFTDNEENYELVRSPRPRKDSAHIHLNLGWDRDQRYGDGKMALHLVYREAIMKSHRTILYNYLSSRFGVDLGELDYYHFEQTHGNDIAGIGRETAVDFHDHARGEGLLHVIGQDEIQDESFLFWGSNGQNISEFEPFEELNGFEIAALNWKFEENGQVGTITLGFAPEVLNPSYRYFFAQNPGTDSMKLSALNENNQLMGSSLQINSGEIVHLLRISPDDIPENFNFYPNPIAAGQMLKFNYLSTTDQQLNLRFYDLRGALVFEATMMVQGGDYLHSFQMPRLRQGRYLLEVTGPSGSLGKMIQVSEM